MAPTMDDRDQIPISGSAPSEPGRRQLEAMILGRRLAMDEAAQATQTAGSGLIVGSSLSNLLHGEFVSVEKPHPAGPPGLVREAEDWFKEKSIYPAQPPAFEVPRGGQAEPQLTILVGLRGRLTGPVEFFAKLLEVWGLDNNDGAKLLGYEDVRFVRDLLSGASSLRTKDVKDRVRYLFEIDAALGQLFRDEAVERDWLREPRPELDGYSPLDILLEGSMEKLLLVKQYVERISGR